ncbi:hypothetical protein VAPA_1c42100 [Variovorax paradoxus B4]|uniref:Uncharacterized protein n=2 Tax=Variovorax paradoxus TaxID=34073 RepID=A0A0H2M9Y1_VARPD|nr:hypothetical protein [Variovorax paradoxus]AGU51286.1 hypothetical protein VAPA_1c42100 [Variovorax paradoxus B4]KLN53850.1 hypothetical protein VPARA_49780 [Variovorax paradoxus]
MKKPMLPLNLCTLVLALAAPAAWAKLAPPPATPEAKAKAAEAAAKTAWSGKVDTYKLCQAQDRVVARYRASATTAGKPVPAAPATPPCADPGPFVFTPPAEAKPIEASGAHSPATTAASPPSTAQPAATANPTPKAQ